MDKQLPEEVLSLTRSLYESGYENEKIAKELSDKGHHSYIEIAMEWVKKCHLEKRRIRGIYFLAAGGLCLFGGFLFSAIAFHSDKSDALNFPLYGLTSIGIVLLLAGMKECIGM